MREQQRAERRRRFADRRRASSRCWSIIGGLTWFAISRGDTTGEAVDASGTPGNTDGYSVVVGDAAAPLTMKFYEDSQCPICQQFEAAVGEQVQAAIADGKVKVDYHMVVVPRPRLDQRLLVPGAPTPCYVVADTAGPDVVREVPRPALREPARRGHGRVPTTTS